MESAFWARYLPLGTMLAHCPAGQWMVGADHSAVDHLECIRQDPAFVQGLHDLLPEPRQDPAPELALDR
jgi:hypothetical protein